MDQPLSNTVVNYSGIIPEIPVESDFAKGNVKHFLNKGSKFLLFSGRVCSRHSKYLKVQRVYFPWSLKIVFLFLFIYFYCCSSIVVSIFLPPLDRKLHN